MNSLCENFTERDRSSPAQILGINSDGEMGWVEKSEVFEAEDDERSRMEFVSRRIQNLFPCAAEELIMQEAIAKYSSFQQKGDLCVFSDLEIICNKCNTTVRIQEGVHDTFRQERTVWLHTLAHGSVEIVVCDFYCVCGTIVRYDGLFDGLFSILHQNAFSREVLDSWVYDVCCLGLTFRESFASWKRKMRSTCSAVNWIQNEPTVLRRIANDAFSRFLKLLRFSTEDAVKKLFTCKKCTQLLPNGQLRWSGILMNGTATGILDVLPDFHCETRVLIALNRISEIQYIIPTPKHR